MNKLEYDRTWRANNKASTRASSRLWKAKLSPVARDEYLKKERIGAKKRIAANPVRNRLLCIKSRAKKQCLAFNLTEDWFLAHFSQGCEITGVELNFEKLSPWAVEVDRIKPGGDYTMDNCRLVCAIYNRSRMSYPDSAVRKFLSSLVDQDNER